MSAPKLVISCWLLVIGSKRQRHPLYQNPKPKTQNQPGFTLIELMVAISIVAILSTIGVVMFSSAQGSARDAKRKGDLEDIKKALYLVQASSGRITGAGGFWDGWSASANDGSWGMDKTAAGTMGGNLVTTKFLKTPVHDPKCPGGACASWNDYYISIVNDSTFVLSASLENIAAGTGAGCQAGYNYCITQ